MINQHFASLNSIKIYVLQFVFGVEKKINFQSKLSGTKAPPYSKPSTLLAIG